jgi:hypothetical protein
MTSKSILIEGSDAGRAAEGLYAESSIGVEEEPGDGGFEAGIGVDWGFDVC